MRKQYFKQILILMMALAITAPAWATNGTNLIGIGPVSRGMGGTGVAAPQDAISAIFANPAGMSVLTAPGPNSSSAEPSLRRKSKAL
jgi:long-chain fatty acid transport protein